ncbi:hypothetical protein ACFV90_33820 [Streptomyces sp. NPDC059904]|uniref:hypothetical protein n=1 Tax=Streptomyces sp. NPDC059904 TaxID=3346996 RepID=UPI0036545820
MARRDSAAQPLALIDDVADERADGAGRMTVIDAVLRRRVWVVCMALGGLLVVLDAGRIG